MRPPPGLPLLAASLLVSVVAAACGGRGLGASEGVTFRTEDGFRLSGRVSGSGSRGVVVLAHDVGARPSTWSGFPRDLREDGYRVLTFDYRGAGDSQGAPDPETADRDVRAAARYLAGSASPARVALIGAGRGGVASIVAAAGEPVAVATLSAPLRLGVLDAAAALPRVAGPTLFVAASEDEAAAADAERLFRAAGDRRDIQIVAGHERGTALLDGRRGEKVRALLTDFLRGARA